MPNQTVVNQLHSDTVLVMHYDSIIRLTWHVCVRVDAEVKPVEMVVMSQRLKYELCVSDEKVVLHWQETICCLCNTVCALSSVCKRHPVIVIEKNSEPIEQLSGYLPYTATDAQRSLTRPRDWPWQEAEASQ